VVVAGGIAVALACALVDWARLAPAWFLLVPAAATLLVGVLAVSVDLACGVLYVPLVAWTGAYASRRAVATEVVLVVALMAAPLATDPSSWRMTAQIALLLGPLVAGTALAVARIRAIQDSRAREWDEFATEPSSLASRIRAWAEDVSVESRWPPASVSNPQEAAPERRRSRPPAGARLAFATTAVVPLAAASFAIAGVVFHRSDGVKVPVERSTPAPAAGQEARQAPEQSSVAAGEDASQAPVKAEQGSRSAASPPREGGGGGAGGGASPAPSGAGLSVADATQVGSSGDAGAASPPAASNPATPPASGGPPAGGQAEPPEDAGPPPGHGGGPPQGVGPPPGQSGGPPSGHGGGPPPGHGGGPSVFQAPPGQGVATPPGHGGTPPGQSGDH
jgi:hypothetical protein